MAAALLELRAITKRFGSDAGAMRTAVDAVDLVVREGEIHALVGESGSGKSTLGRIAVRLSDPDGGGVWFEGRDLLALRGRDLRAARRGIQMIFQDSTASLDPRLTARELVGEPWVIHGMHESGERGRRAEELLARVGIPAELVDRRPGAFSGGQRQRIGIARALALEPRLVVCDEPVSALDLSVQAQIVNLLRDLQEERGMGMLFIAHDLSLVRHIADTVSVMYLGRIVESGTRDAVFDRPLHPYTRALLDASVDALATAATAASAGPVAADPEGLIGGCAFLPRCPIAGDECAVSVPPLDAHATGDASAHSAACFRAGSD